MDVDRYLARIGVERPGTLSVETLERLQRAHLTAVPFENLDVFYHRGVSTSPDWSVPKIVTHGRGGWCYEVNGAFATLLEQLGFSVKWLAGTVPPSESGYPDHLAIEVSLDRPYLVDVGFGDSFIRPLPLDSEGPHDGGTGSYRFLFEGRRTTLIFDGPDGPETQYWFDAEASGPETFDHSSHRLQTQPGLKWTKRPFATRLLDGGPDRVTLLHNRIKFRCNGEVTEQPIGSEEEWVAMLSRWFDIAEEQAMDRGDHV